LTNPAGSNFHDQTSLSGKEQHSQESTGPPKKLRITKNEILGCIGGVILMNTVKLLFKTMGTQLGAIPVGVSFLVGYYLIAKIAKRRFLFGVITLTAVSLIGLVLYVPTLTNFSPKEMDLMA
jgi:hypothetical protein